MYSCDFLGNHLQLTGFSPFQAMPKFGLSSFLLILVLLYIGYSCTSFYYLFFPETCKVEALCLHPAFSFEEDYSMTVYASTRPVLTDDLTFLWSKSGIRLNQSFESDLNISLPASVRRNGSYHLYVFLRHGRHTVQSQVPITAYRVPQRTVFNLLAGKESEETSENAQVPVTHWRQKVTINVLNELITFDREKMPPELIPMTRLSDDRTSRGGYLPMLYCNPMLFREKELVPLNESSKTVQLMLSFQPLSVGKLRLWATLERSMDQMRALGFQEKDIEEMRGIFADTNFYFLVLTVTIAAFHLMFDFLAFKNDISFWRNTTSTAGLSARTVTWRSFSSVVILLYLFEENTSLLVLVPASVGALIEFWKLGLVWKVRLGGPRLLKFETRSTEERTTESFDSQGMRYLAIPLVPLCCGAAVYSLIYVPHKSWYSWTINSLANCVYAFGFLFMTPQLFINYKLKSVAHLPWKALTYKAFNTFIDDFFAFIITMPTAHRLACFRDDVVFLIYVYQRWLYPVDKSRAAEGAQYFAEDSDERKTK